ncbi:uncharacterized protein LOC127245322 isoform X2 [Andrographis paniculata]|uniref:uncharacterized protein LOC127245322 isoform X2 n=1 Tax=Andrographis paniculata TaxID=175694 RepID=UPI0021E887F5|nr:uncharacterized protein LOC127245322 isoform X2 [Andrographis paniculata]
MGTKIHCESYLPVHHSMRDLNEDSSSSSWPICYGDNPVMNGQYYNGYAPRAAVELCPSDNKDALKQKMLEHEAVFKDQVYELHRLYRRQRDIMEEVRRNESMEPSSSSSLRAPSDDARKRQITGFAFSNSHSPLSCTKGNGPQPCPPIPYQNGSASKEPVALDSRPSKLRKKLFDLQLPPDDCIDLEEGEKLPEIKVSDLSSYASNANLRTDHPVPEPDCRIVASSSASQVRNSTYLADLNEPATVEDVVELSPADFLSRNNSINGVNGGTTHVRNGFLIDSVERSGRSIVSSSNHQLHQDKMSILSCPGQGAFTLTNHPPGGQSNGRCREDLWKMGSHQPLPVHSSYPFFGSSLPGSWPQPAASWTNPNINSTQKIAAPESTLSPSPVPWRVGSSSTLYQNKGGEPITANGFYAGSSSGSKDLKTRLSSGFDYRPNAASNHAINNGFVNLSKSASRVDSKPGLDINLNETAMIQQDPGSKNGKGKQEEYPETLPWLKHKQKIEDLNEPIVLEAEVLVKKETQNVMKILGVSVFETGALEPKKPSPNALIADCDKDRKRKLIDINLECVPESEEEVVDEREKRSKVGSVREYFDLNSLASDTEDLSGPSYQAQATTNVKTVLEIDLEAPAVVDEDEDNDDNDKASFEEDTVCKAPSIQVAPEELIDEVSGDAAKTLATVSLFFPEVSTEPAESLIWFADALSNDLSDLSDEIDEFEAMTLQLQETEVEDYMPKPVAPEIINNEDSGVSTRPRRGQARRGRQRRDFQRDILPGLATLSRHEVTEDLQIFGGVMRATGHQWNSGLTRRNGTKTRGGRGRRRAVVVSETVRAAVPVPMCAPAVQPVNSIESGLEDRSLTGWGKMPRRPRRQRCPAAGNNSPAVVLT